ncbi:MAG TPA: matrixin family metalloprotease, partial [Polyangiaceae bacterium]|nr:matrixin family metalloprotease [Polyangiaceae bacterium]
PGGGSPRFDVQFEGYVSCNRREAICESADKNDNVIMFHDTGWHDGVTHIGVTTPTGGKESGLIVDADVEINSQDYHFDSGPNGMPTSLRYVLTHELGHFLGLAHSPVSDSVMSLAYQSRPVSSNLIAADDVAAICAVYPPGPALSCGPARGPAYDMCQIPVGEHPPCQLASVSQAAGCGCRLAQSAAASRVPLAMTWAALGLLFTAFSARRASKPAKAAARRRISRT